MAVESSRRRTKGRQESVAGYLFVAIPMALFLIFQFGALFFALFISFFRWEILGPTAFIGLRNYQFLLTDPNFHKAVLNTVYYTVIVVPLEMALGLTLAVVVNQIWFGKAFYDGEGTTGVGGLGYFDTRAKQFFQLRLLDRPGLLATADVIPVHSCFRFHAPNRNTFLSGECFLVT